MKIRRLGLAAAAAGLALAGLSTATAAAEPSCADVHYIGAAGSGQRDGASLVNPGPEEMLQPGDNVILLGNEAQINAARLLLRGPEEA